MVLSNPSIIRECLDLHGATTSSRPFFYVKELISNNCEIGFMEYGRVLTNTSYIHRRRVDRWAGSTWRNMRRAAHDVLSAEACVKYIPIQRAEACKLMLDFLDRPQVCLEHREIKIQNGTLTKRTYLLAIHHTYLSIRGLSHLFSYLWHPLPRV